MTQQATQIPVPSPDRRPAQTGLLAEARRALHRLSRSYAPHEHRPLAGYAQTMTAYVGAVAGLALLSRALRRPVPERPALADVALISVATHKLSRVLAKDAVTSPLRAPFTRFAGAQGESEVGEEVRAPKGTSEHALGELLTCPFCLAMWVATGLTGGLVLMPRTTRLVAGGLTAVAVSDFLQLAYAAAKSAAKE